MGCCCSQPDTDTGGDEVRSPLLGAKERNVSQNPKYDSMNEPIVAPAPSESRTEPTTNVKDERETSQTATKSADYSKTQPDDTTVPKDFDGTLVNVEDTTPHDNASASQDNAPAFLDVICKDLLRQYRQYDGEVQDVKNAVRNLELMYPDHNPDSTVSGCLDHIRQACGSRVVKRQQSDDRTLQLCYHEGSVDHSYIPALVEFNKACEHVCQVVDKGSALDQQFDDALSSKTTDSADENVKEILNLKDRLAAVRTDAVALRKTLVDASEVFTAEKSTAVGEENQTDEISQEVKQNNDPEKENHRPLSTENVQISKEHTFPPTIVIQSPTSEEEDEERGASRHGGEPTEQDTQTADPEDEQPVQAVTSPGHEAGESQQTEPTQDSPETDTHAESFDAQATQQSQPVDTMQEVPDVEPMAVHAESHSGEQLDSSDSDVVDPRDTEEQDSLAEQQKITTDDDTQESHAEVQNGQEINSQRDYKPDDGETAPVTVDVESDAADTSADGTEQTDSFVSKEDDDDSCVTEDSAEPDLSRSHNDGGLASPDGVPCQGGDTHDGRGRANLDEPVVTEDADGYFVHHNGHHHDNDDGRNHANHDDDGRNHANHDDDANRSVPGPGVVPSEVSSPKVADTLTVNTGGKLRLESDVSSVSEYHEALENIGESPRKSTSSLSTLVSNEGTFVTDDDDDD